MKTPNLFNVPKDQPSRKEQLEAYKVQYGIQTHNAHFRSRKDNPWSACLMVEARKIEYLGILPSDGIFEACAKGCRILEENGFLVTCETERGALRMLAENFGFPGPP